MNRKFDKSYNGIQLLFVHILWAVLVAYEVFYKGEPKPIFWILFLGIFFLPCYFLLVEYRVMLDKVKLTSINNGDEITCVSSYANIRGFLAKGITNSFCFYVIVRAEEEIFLSAEHFHTLYIGNEQRIKYDPYLIPSVLLYRVWPKDKIVA